MFVPKVIWSNGNGTYPIIDEKGEYGLTQFSYGIEDEVKNLKFIKNAMSDPKFIKLMTYVAYTQNVYHYKIIGAFKKDFWKEFDYKTKHPTFNDINKSKKVNKNSCSNSKIKTKKNNTIINNNKQTNKSKANSKSQNTKKPKTKKTSGKTKKRKKVYKR